MQTSECGDGTIIHKDKSVDNMWRHCSLLHPKEAEWETCPIQKRGFTLALQTQKPRSKSQCSIHSGEVPILSVATNSQRLSTLWQSSVQLGKSEGGPVKVMETQKHTTFWEASVVSVPHGGHATWEVFSVCGWLLLCLPNQAHPSLRLSLGMLGELSIICNNLVRWLFGWYPSSSLDLNFFFFFWWYWEFLHMPYRCRTTWAATSAVLLDLLILEIEFCFYAQAPFSYLHFLQSWGDRHKPLCPAFIALVDLEPQSSWSQLSG
jgi:hypothetical protein